jgi:peroxiredoxin Q/BCP
MIEHGSPFPEFELPAHDGSTVSSASLAGRAYLLYFYPKAATPGCTREACELRDHWSELAAADLEVYGVSYDPPEANRAFAERQRLPFLLLSDRDRSLAGTVGAARLLLPVPKRISYLVGADGRVLKAYPSVTPSAHAAEVLEDFKRLAAGE